MTTWGWWSKLPKHTPRANASVETCHEVEMTEVHRRFDRRSNCTGDCSSAVEVRSYELMMLCATKREDCVNGQQGRGCTIARARDSSQEKRLDGVARTMTLQC